MRLERCFTEARRLFPREGEIHGFEKDHKKCTRRRSSPRRRGRSVHYRTGSDRQGQHSAVHHRSKAVEEGPRFGPTRRSAALQGRKGELAQRRCLRSNLFFDRRSSSALRSLTADSHRNANTRIHDALDQQRTVEGIFIFTKRVCREFFQATVGSRSR